MESMDYNPDQDPLIQRARGRGPRGHGFLKLVLIILVCWIAYRDVLPKLSGALDNQAGPRLVSRPVDMKDTRPGPYRVAWQKGQKALYGFSTRVDGKGSPSLTGSTGLNIGFDADVSVLTEDVDAEGNMTTRLAFEDVNMSGNFLGYPVDLRKRGGITQSYVASDVAPPQTALNSRFAPPSTDVFDTPMSFKITPKGIGVSAEAETPLDRFVLTIMRLSGSAFPVSSLQPGDTWENDYDLDWPGMKAPVAVHVSTTLAEEGPYWGRDCACFVQQVTPGSAHSKVLSKIGRIDVSGQSRFFFDKNEGRTIYYESDLTFDLILNAALEKASETFGIYTGLLEDMEGGKKFDLANAAKKEEKAEPIGFRVRSTLALKG